MKRRIATLAVVLTLAGGATAVTVSAQATPAPAARQGAAVVDHAKPAAKPTKKQILGLFDRWNATLATGSAEKVAALYAPDAVLLPTVSPIPRTDHAGIVDYFERFLPNKPQGKKVESFVEIVDRDTAVDAGLYDFTLTAKDGTKSVVRARYTFVYEKIGGQWKILSHHSSVLPAAS